MESSNQPPANKKRTFEMMETQLMGKLSSKRDFIQYFE